MVAALFCVSCGAELQGSDLFCHACGEAADSAGGLREHPEALLPLLVALFGWGFLISAGNTWWSIDRFFDLRWSFWAFAVMNTISAVLTLGAWWFSLRLANVLEERQKVGVRGVSGALMLAGLVLAFAIPLIAPGF